MNKRNQKRHSSKRMLKKSVKAFFIVLLLAITTCFLGYEFYLKDKIEEMTRVGFMSDPKDETKIIYKNDQHEIVYGALDVGNKHYYFDDKTGAMIIGQHKEKDGIRLYGKDGAMITGYHDQDDGKHYYNEDGLMVTGVQVIDEETHVFNENGVMLVNQYLKGIDGNLEHISYLDENGKVVKGRRNIDGEDRYFDENGNLSLDIDALQKGVEELLSHWSGDISVYFKDLSDNQSFSINNHQFYPCCMIKVPSLITLYNAIGEGRLQKTDQVAHWIDLMIRISDNTSYNNLMIRLGGGDGVAGVNEVTETAHNIGMLDTQDKHGLIPGENYFTVGGGNRSTPVDIGIALEKIYRHEVSTDELCDEMLDLLKSCDDKDELGKGLPEGTVFANKTGCADTIYHDGGIVYGPTGDYILVCFSNGANYVPMMTALSEYVYNFEANLIPEGI